MKTKAPSRKPIKPPPAPKKKAAPPKQAPPKTPQGLGLTQSRESSAKLKQQLTERAETFAQTGERPSFAKGSLGTLLQQQPQTTTGVMATSPLPREEQTKMATPS